MKRHYSSEERYFSFSRFWVNMSGPETDDLIGGGKLITPYPHQICTANFPLGREPFSDLLVFVDIEKNWGKTIADTLVDLELEPPEERHAIRFVSQFVQGNPYQAHIGKNIIFPHESAYIPKGIKIVGTFAKDQDEMSASWLTSKWRSQDQKPELCLWRCLRDWSHNKGDLIAGVAKHLRMQHGSPAWQARNMLVAV